ncbi:MAG: peptide deformylase [Erysipelotrichaceae bacterium]|jgi:peptide deformylase|nr:peptide deformylase [Erysipelotrichaceae bacterium]
MKLKIIKDSNPIMRQVSSNVDLPLSKEDKQLLDDMLEYLKLSQDDEYAEKHNIKAGVGLAAIQVGVLKRMFVVYYHDEEGKEVAYQIVNPKIIETSVKKCALSNGEGCLSVDNPHEGLTHRYFKINMEAYDALQVKKVHIIARGYDAVVLQHEYDHLDGKFFYDRIDKNNPTKQLDGEILL